MLRQILRYFIPQMPGIQPSVPTLFSQATPMMNPMDMLAMMLLAKNKDTSKDGFLQNLFASEMMGRPNDLSRCICMYLLYKDQDDYADLFKEFQKIMNESGAQ